VITFASDRHRLWKAGTGQKDWTGMDTILPEMFILAYPKQQSILSSAHEDTKIHQFVQNIVKFLHNS
jgi:hypothetical protein